jgi:SAM-dependent methyltransferase
MGALFISQRDAVDASSLTSLFGHNAGYVAAVIIVAVLVLLVLAFTQGREVSFWPPKIGPSVPAGEDESADQPQVELVGTCESPGSRDSTPGNATITLEVCDANIFYQAIAPNYDERNSANLLATHMDTIERIEQARTGKLAPRILDLGGGTGQNIATHFFNDEHIRWDYVDSCPEMANQLQKHLAGRPLYRNLTMHVGDINRLQLLGFPQKAFDVIVLSLVLSSMPQLPDFGVIAALLSPGGSLVISDINPKYTQAHPYYEVRVEDGGVVAMHMNPVGLLEMLRRAKSAGLNLTELTPIGDEDPSYSFIATFRVPIRPGTDDGPKSARKSPSI